MNTPKSMLPVVIEARHYEDAPSVGAIVFYAMSGLTVIILVMLLMHAAGERRRLEHRLSMATRALTVTNDIVEQCNAQMQVLPEPEPRFVTIAERTMQVCHVKENMTSDQVLKRCGTPLQIHTRKSVLGLQEEWQYGALTVGLLNSRVYYVF